MTPTADKLAEALKDLVIDVENGWGDPHTLDDARQALADYSAHASQAEPVDWVLVPKEPTTEQLRALLVHRGYDPDAKEETLDVLGNLDIATMGVFVSAYRVMIASAPPPPEPKEQG